MRPTETESGAWENHRGSTLLAEFTLFRCTQLHPVEGRCTVLFCLTVESNMLSHKGFRSKRLAVQWLFDTQEVRGSSPLSPTQFGTEKAQEPFFGCFVGRPLGRSNDSRLSLAARSAGHDSEPNG